MSLEEMTPGDREAVEEFRQFLTRQKETEDKLSELARKWYEDWNRLVHPFVD